MSSDALVGVIEFASFRAFHANETALLEELLPVVGMTAIIALSALVAGIPGLLGYCVAALRRAGSPGELREQAALVAEAELP